MILMFRNPTSEANSYSTVSAARTAGVLYLVNSVWPHNIILDSRDIAVLIDEYKLYQSTTKIEIAMFGGGDMFDHGTLCLRIKSQLKPCAEHIIATNAAVLMKTTVIKILGEDNDWDKSFLLIFSRSVLRRNNGRKFLWQTHGKLHSIASFTRYWQ